jgi:SAM-dependent methyltransferase
MASVIQHYADHLGPIYEWMVGDLDAATDAARADLRAANIVDGTGRVAVDLGAGLGTHAIALAEFGFRVIAIDTCGPLLEALTRRSRHGLEITRVQADLQNMRRHCAGPVDVIACMGDTLTHLPSPAAVSRLLKTIVTVLAPGGTFVATFRDYSARPVEGNCRVIPVRHDDDRILTCVLEYHAKTLTVHDVIHERTAAGWSFRVSSYPKLRLNPWWVRSTLSRFGMTVTAETTPQGMVRLAATRAA